MRWKPEHGALFFYIYQDGVGQSKWVGSRIDIRDYKMGRCFRTRKQAEQAAVKVRKLLLSLQKEKIWASKTS